MNAKTREHPPDLVTLTAVDASVLRELQSREQFFWLDLADPDPKEIDELGEILKLHELAIEDTREFGQRPKLDAYADELLLAYYGARLDSDGRPVPVELHLHVSRRFVITVHHGARRQFDLIRDSFEHQSPSDPGTVVYKVINALTDSIVDVLERVADQVEDSRPAMSSTRCGTSFRACSRPTATRSRNV